MWVPSHIGITGHKCADKLAMETARSPDTKLYSHVTYEDVIHALKIICYSLWQNIWDKQIWSDPLIKLKHHEKIMVTRVRIGHTKLIHSHLMCKDPESKRETCLNKLIIKNIFLECPIYQNARTKSNLNASSLKEAFNYGEEK